MWASCCRTWSEFISVSLGLPHVNVRTLRQCQPHILREQEEGGNYSVTFPGWQVWREREGGERGWNPSGDGGHFVTSHPEIASCACSFYICCIHWQWDTVTHTCGYYMRTQICFKLLWLQLRSAVLVYSYWCTCTFVLSHTRKGTFSGRCTHFHMLVPTWHI